MLSYTKIIENKVIDFITDLWNKNNYNNIAKKCYIGFTQTTSIDIPLLQENTVYCGPLYKLQDELELNIKHIILEKNGAFTQIPKPYLQNASQEVVDDEVIYNLNINLKTLLADLYNKYITQLNDLIIEKIINEKDNKNCINIKEKQDLDKILTEIVTKVNSLNNAVIILNSIAFQELSNKITYDGDNNPILFGKNVICLNNDKYKKNFFCLVCDLSKNILFVHNNFECICGENGQYNGNKITTLNFFKGIHIDYIGEQESSLLINFTK